MEDLYEGAFEGLAGTAQNYIRDYSLFVFAIAVILLIYVIYTFFSAKKDSMYSPGATALYKSVNWSENMDSGEQQCPANPNLHQTYQQYAMDDAVSNGKWASTESFSDAELAAASGMFKQ